MSGVIGLIGLGMRAGHVVVGVDAVRSALQAGKCACVVVAVDATPRTQEKVVRLATAKGVPLVEGPGAALLGERLGRPPVMVVGIRDRALAAGVLGAAAARQ
ncbi:MAG TPA: ribosomal L7Ae/L30e/S12e/Gadd45 family protein [Gemmatimonadales bacterium]|nr:ribosomal L7Ae/L30e/S12e/Gadd45 family protein [Gemmatimonadales bacterium]